MKYRTPSVLKETWYLGRTLYRVQVMSTLNDSVVQSCSYGGCLLGWVMNNFLLF